MLGDVEKEGLAMLKAADDILLKKFKSGNIPGNWASICCALPCKSVGVMGDRRTYEKVIALRAVQTSTL